MKKMLLTTLALTMFLPLADYAAAKNHDDDAKSETAVEASPMFKGMHAAPNPASKQRKAEQHKPDKKELKKQRGEQKEGENQPIIYSSTAMQHQMDEINAHYQKALHKIAKSSFSKELRNLLSEQAAENRDLALRQLKEKMDLCAKHACERMQFQGELKHNEHAHKLIEKIDNI